MTIQTPLLKKHPLKCGDCEFSVDPVENPLSSCIFCVKRYDAMIKDNPCCPWRKNLAYTDLVSHVVRLVLPFMTALQKHPNPIIDLILKIMALVLPLETFSSMNTPFGDPLDDFGETDHVNA